MIRWLAETLILKEQTQVWLNLSERQEGLDTFCMLDTSFESCEMKRRHTPTEIIRSLINILV